MAKFMKNNVLLMLMFLFLINPRGIDSIPILKIIFDIGRVISFLIVLHLYIVNNKVSAVIIAVIAFQGVLLFSTIINQGNYWRYMVYCSSMIGVCMLIEMGIRYNLLNLLNSITNVLLVLICINFWSVLPALHGDRVTYGFLGHRNDFIQIFIPCICISLIYAYFRKERLDIKTIFIIAISIITTISVWSAATLIGMAMILVFLVFLYKHNSSHIFNINTYLFVVIFSFVSVVLLRIQNYFAFFFEIVLKRNATFTGRTDIWDAYFSYIRQAPVFGYGLETYDQVASKFVYTHAHNQFISMIYQGGFLVLIIFIIFVFIACEKLRKLRKNEFSKIISFFIFTLFIMMFSTVFEGNGELYCGLLIISYYADVIIYQHEVYKLKSQINKIIKKNI